jgi:hypothetical protein
MEFADYVEIQFIFQTHSSIRLFQLGNHFGDREDYRFLEFQGMWPGRCTSEGLAASIFRSGTDISQTR